jgi:hypothetical protein
VIAGFGAAAVFSALPQGTFIAALAIGGAIAILLFIAFMIVFTAIDDTVTIPLTYRYWKEIGKKR